MSVTLFLEALLFFKFSFSSFSTSKRLAGYKSTLEVLGLSELWPLLAFFCYFSYHCEHIVLSIIVDSTSMNIE